MTDDTNNGSEQIALPPPPRANAPARRATLSSETPAGPAGAEGDRSNPRSDAGSSDRRQRKAVPIPSLDELLAQLLSLNGAMLLGQISAPQANLMYRTITAAINVQLKRSSGTQDHVKDTESLVDAIRRNPSLLNTFERFLSDDQLDGLMDELDGDDQQDRPRGE